MKQVKEKLKKQYLHGILYFILCMITLLRFSTEIKAATISGDVTGTIPCSSGSLTWNYTDETGALKITGSGTVNLPDPEYSTSWDDVWGYPYGEEGGFFDYINKVRTIDTTGANIILTSKNGAYMFDNMSKATSINVSGIDTSNATDLTRMFAECSKISSITGFDKLKFSNLETANQMFAGSGITNAGDYIIDAPKLKYFSKAFYDCYYLKGTQTFYADKYTELEMISGLFKDCTNITNVNITIKNCKLFSTSELVSGCSSLEQATINIDYTENCHGMFSDCENLREITYGNLFSMENCDITSTTGVDGIYSNCKSLVRIVCNSSNKIFLPTTAKYSFKPMGTSSAKWVTDTDKMIYGGYNAPSTKNNVYKLAIPSFKFNIHQSDGTITSEKLSHSMIYGEEYTPVDVMFLFNDDIIMPDGYAWEGYYHDELLTKKIAYFSSKFSATIPVLTGDIESNEIIYLDGIDVYIKWTPLKYRIFYELNNGTNASSNITSYTVESNTISLNDPEKEGYTFAGWYSDSKFTKKVTEIPKGSTGDIKLYASWQCNHEKTRLDNFTEATCCTDGYTGDEYCTTCGDKIGTGTVIPATGTHKTTVTGAKEATCEEEGYTGNIYCTNSNQLLSNGTSIPKISHNKDVLKKQKEATCTEEGYTGDKHCSMCGALQESGTAIPMIAHNSDITKNNKAATCEADGYTGDKYCSVCNTLQEEGSVIPATGHTGGKADCSHKAVCQTCNEEYGDFDTDCHNPETRNKKEAGCEDGYTGDVYCKDCDELIQSGDTIPGIGHLWDNGKITKEPTYEEDGERIYTCTVCNKEHVEVLTKLDKDCAHENTEVRNKVESTCEKEGYSGDTYCIDCENLLSVGEVIPKTEHTWGTDKIIKNPTYESNGEKIQTCTVCGEEKTVAIPALVKDTKPNPVPQTPNINTPDNGNNQKNNNITNTPVAVNKVSKVSNLKVKNNKKTSITISFKKIDGVKYQLQYSADKKFKKSVKKKTLTKTSHTVKNLKKGKTYYVRVRAYKTVDGKTVYGNWSAVKKVKIKK